MKRFPRAASGLATLIVAAAALRAVAGGSDTEHGAGALPEAPRAVTHTTFAYQVPDLMLVRSDGKRVSLVKELDDGRPVLLNFIFTTCSSTCPLSSQTFAEFQRRLGAEAAGVHLVSISIDPEQDTPARLTEYARRFHAGPGWQYYTGTLEASLRAQRAFDVYRGDKMDHPPITLMRRAPGETWLRIEGFVTPEDLLASYRTLVVAR